MSELKPCPHCGVVPEIVGGGVWPVCKCYMEDYEDGPLDISAWNNRPIEDALRAELKKERELSTKLYLLLVDNPDTKLLADQILIDHDKD